MMEEFIETLREMRAPFMLSEVIEETALPRYNAMRNLVILCKKGVLYKDIARKGNSSIAVYNFVGKISHDPEEMFRAQIGDRRYEDMRFRSRAVA